MQIRLRVAAAVNIFITDAEEGGRRGTEKEGGLRGVDLYLSLVETVETTISWQH